MDKIIISLATLLFFISCSKDKTSITPETSMYFPSNSNWETTSIEALKWNQEAIEPLKDFLKNTDTKSFLILVNGRIVMEEYFNGHSAAATWEWNSAGKSLVSATIGIAQQENLIDIDFKASDYLGTEWTNMSLEKENLITVENLLSMTSGIDDSKQLVIKPNLTYVADAETRWAYGNVFQKLINIVSESSNKEFETYFNEKIKNKIGMDGYWNRGLVYTIYHSTTKSMARFGLLALNNGSWSNEQIIDKSYFSESINTSQNINPSYGYLWWLNGKNNYMVPNSQTVFSGAIVPNAPNDMYAAMGANDQRIYVVPSKNLVVVRMGEASNPDDPDFAISGFDNSLWEKLTTLID